MMGEFDYSKICVSDFVGRESLLYTEKELKPQFGTQVRDMKERIATGSDMPAAAVHAASYMFLTVGKVAVDSAWKGKLKLHAPCCRTGMGKQ
jgi:hypothetical protein